MTSQAADRVLETLARHHGGLDGLVVGVYAGFDQASRCSVGHVAIALERRGMRVVSIRPSAVSPIGEVTEKVRQRLLGAHRTDLDVLVDACPRPRTEAALLAAALEVPYVPLGSEDLTRSTGDNLQS